MPIPRFESSDSTAAELIERLRGDLGAASYTVGTVNALWGDEAAEALLRGQRLPAERALASTAGGSSTATLARLFILGLPVGSAELSAALPRLSGAGAQELGLVSERGGIVHPLLDLRPYSFSDRRGPAEWWIGSDLGELALGHAIPESHVLGVGGASMTLSGLIIGSEVERALDLGTGCGIQALHLSRYTREVVATDISERALGLARFNCELNGVDNVRFVHGSLFEPVEGERFDVIVSNPPFVITPRSPGVPAYEYRDGGMVGDALVRSVVESSAAHLNPGGVVQLLGNWEYHDDHVALGRGVLDRVRGWFTGDAPAAALDAWVVEREVQDAASYAETWIRDGGTRPGTTEFDALYASWLDDFSKRSVRSVGFGYLTLRLPADGPPTLRRFERIATSGTNPTGLGEYVAAAIAAHDQQHRLSDEALARERLTVAADVTEERHYWPGAEDPTVIVLHQGSGFGRSVEADTALAAFVGACDGELTVEAIARALASILEADEDALRSELIAGARELLVEGFLHVAEAPGP